MASLSSSSSSSWWPKDADERQRALKMTQTPSHASPMEAGPFLPSLWNGRSRTGPRVSLGRANGVSSTSSLPPLVMNGALPRLHVPSSSPAALAVAAGGPAAAGGSSVATNGGAAVDSMGLRGEAGAEEEEDEAYSERLGLSNGSAETDEQHQRMMAGGSSLLPSLVPSPRSSHGRGRLPGGALVGHGQEEEPEPSTFEDLVQAEMRMLEAELWVHDQLGGGAALGVTGGGSDVNSGGSGGRSPQQEVESLASATNMDATLPRQPLSSSCDDDVVLEQEGERSWTGASTRSHLTASSSPRHAHSKAFGRGLLTLFSPADEEIAARRRQKLAYARALVEQMQEQQQGEGYRQGRRHISVGDSDGSARRRHAGALMEEQDEGMAAATWTGLPIGELEASPEMPLRSEQQQQRRRRSSVLLPASEGESDETDELLRREGQREYARALDTQVAARRRQLLAGEAEGVRVLSPLSARRLRRMERDAHGPELEQEQGPEPVMASSSPSPSSPSSPSPSPPSFLPMDAATGAVAAQRRQQQQALYAAALRQQMEEAEARRREERARVLQEETAAVVPTPTESPALLPSPTALAALSQARRRLMHDVYGPQTSPWGPASSSAPAVGVNGGSMTTTPHLGPPTVRAPPPTPASPAAALSAAAAAIEAEARAVESPSSSHSSSSIGTGAASGTKPLLSFARHGARALDKTLEASLEERQRLAREQRQALEKQMEEKRARESRAEEERREEERRLLELLRRAEEAELEGHARRRRLQLADTGGADAAVSTRLRKGTADRGHDTSRATGASASGAAVVAADAEHDETTASLAVSARQEESGVDGVPCDDGGLVEESLEANSKFLPSVDPSLRSSFVRSRPILFPPIDPAALSPKPAQRPTLSAQRQREGFMMTGSPSAAALIPIPVRKAAAAVAGSSSSSSLDDDGGGVGQEAPFEASLASESTLLYLSSEEKRRLDAQFRKEQAHWQKRFQGKGNGDGNSNGSRKPSGGSSSSGSSTAATLSPPVQMFVWEADELLAGRVGQGAASVSLGQGDDDGKSPLRDISNRPAGESPSRSKATTALPALLQADHHGKTCLEDWLVGGVRQSKQQQ